MKDAHRPLVYLPLANCNFASGVLGPEEYHFVNQGDCFELRQVEDEDEFAKTKSALKTMGFEDDSVRTIFDITAGLIHLGELEFESNAEDEAAVLSEDEDVM